MNLPITAPYIALLAIYAIVFGAMVSIHRAKTGVSLAYGDDMTLLEKIRRHGNFAETVPLALLLMIAAELQGANGFWLHISGILLLVSRLIHPFGINHTKANAVARGIGSAGTTLAMLICIIIILWPWLGG
ncbi:MAG: MAPEG family protein [Rhizobiaceae bacterium]